jgi:hypothetical protein
MKSKDLVALDEPCGLDSILDSHGKIIADAQRGKFEFDKIADELHIHRQSCVPGIIKIALLALDDESAISFPAAKQACP